jgi:hypothetical protein
MSDGKGRCVEYVHLRPVVTIVSRSRRGRTTPPHHRGGRTAAQIVQMFGRGTGCGTKWSAPMCFQPSRVVAAASVVAGRGYGACELTVFQAGTIRRLQRLWYMRSDRKR